MTQRRGRGPAADTRARLLSGTLECLREHGLEGTTVAAVSRRSGLSRPTIYAHFDTLATLVHQTVEDAAVDLSARIAADLDEVFGAGERIVEFVVAAHREFKSDPVVALVLEVSAAPDLAEHNTISPAMLRLTRQPLRAALRDDPAALDRLDDIIETMLRFLLSVLTYTSDNTRTDERLRAYLRRTMLAALGLTAGARAAPQ